MKKYKVYIKDEETSRKVQEQAVSLGYAWEDGKCIYFFARPFYFFSEKYSIMCGTSFGEFRLDKSKELTPEEFLKLTKEEIQEEIQEKNKKEFSHFKLY